MVQFETPQIFSFPGALKKKINKIWTIFKKLTTVGWIEMGFV
jgi:hypothetical protein